MNDLNKNEIERYSRQLIIPNFGKNGQNNLKSKSVLIIGCGGLGCPAALYLAASGIGKLGLVDNDRIDITNLHRQIAYTENKIGEKKVFALAAECKLRNSSIFCDAYDVTFDKDTAIAIIEKYDVILDCTDNVMTRYLINDCCVISGRPLISGSALRYDGQLTVYNYNGPCLRCIYPIPPPQETVGSCSEAGILGPIVGVIGTLQAIEAIKILTKIGDCLNGRLLIFDGLSFISRVVSLRKTNPNCEFCNKLVTCIESYDYLQFCGSKYNDKIDHISVLDSTCRITCQDYCEVVRESLNHVLLDVRPTNEFDVCSLPNSINIDLEKLQNEKDVYSSIDNILKENKTNKIYVVCRRGNDSQIAVNLLKNNMENEVLVIKDLIGGLHEWHDSIDFNFPKF